MPGNDTEPRDDLVYGGVCPVCDDEFIDGYDDLEEGESYEARICVDEIDGDGEGKMLVHLTGDEDDEKTPQQKWAEHNESFNYEPPERPPDAWSSEEYQELWDRLINKRTEWTCQKCSKPFNRLDRARRHVESQHSEQLLDKFAPDPETATDGGQPEQKTETESREQRAKEENHGLTEFGSSGE